METRFLRRNHHEVVAPDDTVSWWKAIEVHRDRSKQRGNLVNSYHVVGGVYVFKSFFGNQYQEAHNLSLK